MSDFIATAIVDASENTQGMAKQLISSAVFFEDKVVQLPGGDMSLEDRKRLVEVTPTHAFVGIIPNHLEALAAPHASRTATEAVYDALDKLTEHKARSKILFMFETQEWLEEINESRRSLGRRELRDRIPNTNSTTNVGIARK